MLSPTDDPKQALRQHYRQVRQALGAETRLEASRVICARIEDWPVFQDAETVLTYMPMKSEVDLLPLLERFPRKQWVLPRILPGEARQMAFHRYDPQRLIRHAFGMAEPSPDLARIPPETIQLVLVPGLAYDPSGWRLGYGGGYYDRFLSGFGGIRIGVVFEALLVKELPHAAHDIAMQWLVTEKRLIAAAGQPSSPAANASRNAP